MKRPLLRPDPAARAARLARARARLTATRRSPRDALARAAAARASALGRLRARPRGGRRAAKQDDPRPRRALIAALLLLLLLILLCTCGSPPTPAPGPAPAPEPAVAAPEPPAPPPPLPRQARIDRPAFDAPPPGPPPWLTSFRMQVAARSPRLAQCFEGMARPGALKWTTGVEPSSGRVSAHVVEPMLASDELTGAQRACVLAVLEDPPYRLPPESEGGTPSRVSLVLEF